MKLKISYKALLVTLVAILTLSCNDNLERVGFSIQPEKIVLPWGLTHSCYRHER